MQEASRISSDYNHKAWAGQDVVDKFYLEAQVKTFAGLPRTAFYQPPSQLSSSLPSSESPTSQTLLSSKLSIWTYTVVNTANG
ncbi:unnamed protein product [Rhizoctonia solani]|nr:unnamed protein product [Rhizoctonia solani]